MQYLCSSSTDHVSDTKWLLAVTNQNINSRSDDKNFFVSLQASPKIQTQQQTKVFLHEMPSFQKLSKKPQKLSKGSLGVAEEGVSSKERTGHGVKEAIKLQVALTRCD